jgi:hypothetical protein
MKLDKSHLRLKSPYRFAPPHGTKPSVRVHRPTPHAVVSATRGDWLGLTSSQATVTSTPSRSQTRVWVSKDNG